MSSSAVQVGARAPVVLLRAVTSTVLQAALLPSYHSAPLVLERSIHVGAAPPREHHPRAMSPTRAALLIRERIYKCPPSTLNPQPSIDREAEGRDGTLTL